MASTIPSANCDVRISQTLWDLEVATQGGIRTTCQAWVWDKEMVDKRCVVYPFLGGALAPPCVSPAQLDVVSSTLKKLFVQSKQAAPLPTEGGATAAARTQSQQQQQQQQNTITTTPSASAVATTTTTNNKPPTSQQGLSQAPPRPGATAAASTQAQQLHATTPAPSSLNNNNNSIPECNICMEYFDATTRKPLILSCCGHSICADCWKGIVERRREGSENVPCPRCREELPVNQRLVPNRTLLEQISS